LATHKPVSVDELFGELAISETAEKWHVIHTKPQCEKKLAGYLLRNGLYYYLPLVDSVRHYKYRKVMFTKPMFPGYVFSRFNPVEKNLVLLSGCVVNFLKVPSETELLDELQQVYTGQNRQAEYCESVWLQKGWRVEIIKGPMKGIKGVVESQDKLNEVILQVSILRRAVSLSVNPAHVRIIREYRYED
jgi:transcriptional antiterminator RfaH